MMDYVTERTCERCGGKGLEPYIDTEGTPAQDICPDCEGSGHA